MPLQPVPLTTMGLCRIAEPLLTLQWLFNQVIQTLVNIYSRYFRYNLLSHQWELQDLCVKCFCVHIRSSGPVKPFPCKPWKEHVQKREAWKWFKGWSKTPGEVWRGLTASSVVSEEGHSVCKPQRGTPQHPASGPLHTFKEVLTSLHLPSQLAGRGILTGSTAR